ncbi:PREDICTED: putative 57 kDa heat shock protein [Camelina sativa]|uniref:57 kDa heat shock protein n=1 Tax=Camelina sativa TaxID=90675 RepID=A0ABM0V2C5_CAMSA|nr:PREDICTED: putative 57 kDa heat shock protein [Camelina sativa]
MVAPVDPVPQSPDGFYAINNQFLESGPKGQVEIKILENEDTFIRFDLPGVPPNGVTILIDESKRGVKIFAYAPKENKHDASHRSYGLTFQPKLKVGRRKTHLECKCHDISGFTSHMSDGVLRLILNKTPTTTPTFSLIGGGRAGDVSCDPGHHGFLPGTDPDDPNLTGPILMPYRGVDEGSKMAYESKQLPDGQLYLRVDMPGVPKDKFNVSVTNGRVKVTGEAPARGHDSAGRFYSGDVAVLSSPVDLPSRRIKTIAKNGVIRLFIPPVDMIS